VPPRVSAGDIGDEGDGESVETGARGVAGVEDVAGGTLLVPTADAGDPLLVPTAGGSGRKVWCEGGMRMCARCAVLLSICASRMCKLSSAVFSPRQLVCIQSCGTYSQ